MARKRIVRRRVVRLTLFSLATWGFLALGRARGPAVEPVRYEPVREPGDVPGWASAPAPSPRARLRLTRRAAASFAFAVLFFAGASFSAVAGDAVVEAVESAGEDAAEPATTDEAAAAEAVEPPPVTAPRDELSLIPAPAGAEAPAPEPVAASEPVPAPEEVPAPDAVEPAEEVVAPEEAPAPAEGAEAVGAEAEPGASEPSEGQAPVADDGSTVSTPAQELALVPVARGVAAPEVGDAAAEVEPLGAVSARPAAAPRAARTRPAAATPKPRRSPRPHDYGHLDPEVAHPGAAATVWLNRTAPDPTPAALRLTPEFASKLVRESKAAGVDWALVLGVLRAEGARGRVPVKLPTLAQASLRLAQLGARGDKWGAALAFTGRTAGADRAVALARYYRAVGYRALVDGLLAQEDALVARVLADPRIDVYAGGRADLAAGRIDVRVVALVAYLAEAYGQVTVSSLFTGHRVYARPGVVSAHMFGAAVDIAALGGVPVAGNQQPGGLVERAVRDILLLPTEMRPRQLISLLGLGGPSFPLADHGDHIHVGF